MILTPRGKITIPLLLTSSIVAHDPGVKLKDTEARLKHAIESVGQWLRIDPALPIVLCDGSNFDLQITLAAKFPGALIECLGFENDQEKVQKYGRGYGEGEIVRYAIQNSRLIRDATCFAKCSSKLWVENFEQCKKSWNGKALFKGVFLDAFSPFHPTTFQHIDTRFYISSTSFYESYFQDAHQRIDLATGHGLEECFRDVFLEKKLHGTLLPVAPTIQGVGGGTANYYRNSIRRVWKERLRLMLVRRDNKFSTWFANQVGSAKSDI